MNTKHTLIWRVKEVALRKQIATTARELADHTNIAIATARRLWGDVPSQPPRQFDVETLRRLCAPNGLYAIPPACFVWSDTLPPGWAAHDQYEPPYLHWRVREIAEAQGFTLIPFARRARIFYATRPGSTPQMAERLWAGDHRSISLAVMGRVLRTLDLSPGDLLTWER
jgi:DNA-binding Xre family transcriptional regulator